MQAIRERCKAHAEAARQRLKETGDSYVRDRVDAWIHYPVDVRLEAGPIPIHHPSSCGWVAWLVGDIVVCRDTLSSSWMLVHPAEDKPCSVRWLFAITTGGIRGEKTAIKLAELYHAIESGVERDLWGSVWSELVRLARIKEPRTKREPNKGCYKCGGFGAQFLPHGKDKPWCYGCFYDVIS